MSLSRNFALSKPPRYREFVCTTCGALEDCSVFFAPKMFVNPDLVNHGDFEYGCWYRITRKINGWKVNEKSFEKYGLQAASLTSVLGIHLV